MADPAHPPIQAQKPQKQLAQPVSQTARNIKSGGRAERNLSGEQEKRSE